jgi:hypothetical protein
MKPFTFTAFILFAALFLRPAFAEETLPVFGYGSSSCMFWSKERVANPGFTSAWDQWLLGFVSGARRQSSTHSSDPNPLSDPDGVAVLAWIHNYCKDETHGLHQLWQAAQSFILAHP